MADLRISQLPLADGPTAPSPTDVAAIDGLTTRKAPLAALADAIRPLASQSEAEEGTNPTKGMSPLTTMQAINFVVGTPGEAGKEILSLSAADDVRSFLAAPSYVGSRASLKNIDTSKEKTAILSEDGREGLFNWREGDFSSAVSLDAFEGIFVASNSVPSSSGAWVRSHQEGVVVSSWFGTNPDYDPSSGTGTDCAPAFNAALDFADVVLVPPGSYMVSATVNVGPGKTFMCQSPAYANGGFLSDTDVFLKSGVNAILVPRGIPRVHTVNAMISSCDLSGGVLSNPNAGDAYTTSSGTRLNSYRILDLTNRNAVGATAASQRAFNAVVKMSRWTSLFGIAIQSTRNDGGYISQISDMDFGEDIDVGFYAENPYYARIENCRAAWAFRISALLHVNHNSGDGFTPSGDGFDINSCFFEGHRQICVRGLDTCRITAVSSSTVTVKWFASHQFSNSGAIRLNGDSYTYTGLSFVAGSPGDLTFTGVSPNPVTGGVSVGGELNRGQDYNDSGIGEMRIRNCYIRDLTHASLRFGTDGAFSSPFGESAIGIEVAGEKMRGIHLEDGNVYHPREDVLMFFANAGDVFIGGYSEAKTITGTSAASRIIALSVDAMQSGIGSVPHPVGGARNVTFSETWNQVNGAIDTSPANRNQSSIGRFGTTNGLFIPDGVHNPYYSYTSRDGTATRWKAPGTLGDKHPFQFLTQAGGSSVRSSMDKDGRWQWGFALDTQSPLSQPFNFFSNGGFVAPFRNTASTSATGIQLGNTNGSVDFVKDTTSGAVFSVDGTPAAKLDSNTWRPAANNGMDLGTASFNWNNARITRVISSEVRLNGSAVGPFVSSGAGSPEGVLSAPVGSIYTRTDGGVSTTLYVKQSGAGNTGWAAK